MHLKVRRTISLINESDQFQQGGLFDDSLKDIRVKIFSLASKQPKSRSDLGQYYKMQKTFFYKQRAVVFWLLNYMYYMKQNIENNTRNQYKRLMKLFHQSIKQFNTSPTQQHESIHFPIQDFEQQSNLTQSKQKLENLLCFIDGGKLNLQPKLKQEKRVQAEELETFMDILLGKWAGQENVQEEFFGDLTKVFDKSITIEPVVSKEKIMRLAIVSEKDNIEQIQLLYKRMVVKLDQVIIATILQTNQQKHVYFSISPQSFPKIQPQTNINSNLNQPPLAKHPKTPSQTPTPQLTQLFNNNPNQSLIQSQGQHSDKFSDNHSEIVMDDEFYRISSKISTSMRKNSWGSCEKIVVTNQFDGDDVADGRKYGGFLNVKRLDEEKTNVYDSFAPNSHSEQVFELTNRQLPESYPISEIYTRSSSMEKAHFPSKDHLTTSIDLLMKLSFNNSNNDGKGSNNFLINNLQKRKKSCQHVRTYNKSVQRPYSKAGSNIHIRLTDQSKGNVYCQKYNVGVNLGKEDSFVVNNSLNAKGNLGNTVNVGQSNNNANMNLLNTALNERLGVARTFFRASNNNSNNSHITITDMKSSNPKQ